MTPPNPLLDMLRHAVVHTPYYAAQDWAKDFRNGKNIEFKDIPILPQSETKKHTDKFYSTWVPPEDGAIIEKFTSGSTGEPTRILKTAKHFHFNTLENRRLKNGWGLEDHLNTVHSKSPKGETTGEIVSLKTSGIGLKTWTIKSFHSKLVSDLIIEKNASHLHGYPSVALGVLLQRPDIDLRLISTVGETIPHELNALVAERAGLRFLDSFGSIETGIIAIKCSLCEQYHIANRHLLLEVIDDRGHPVLPGEIGRLVLTTLFNTAMPLIRYDICDFVILSENSTCQNGQIGFAKIIGREKDLFKLADGSRVTPMFDGSEMLALGVVRCKLVQVSLLSVEVQYIKRNAEIVVPSLAFQNIIDKWISPTLRAIPIEVSELLPGPNGKYRMHECLI